jgi:hypothetical protein
MSQEILNPAAVQGAEENRLPPKIFNTLTTRSLRRNRRVPAGTWKTKNPKASCKPIPQRIACQFIFLRFVEKTQAIATSTKMPRKLMKF